MNEPVLIITGPTASGKTALGFELARKLNGRIISADSRAVYEELTIGSAKPTLGAKEVLVKQSKMGRITWIDGIAHYLIDVVNLEQTYTAYQFVQDATKIVNYLHRQQILPIIVGGTGLYIEALKEGYQFLPEAKEELVLLKDQSLDQLVNQLKDLDPISYCQIDLKNRLRVIRALSFTQKTGKSFIKAQQKNPPPWDIKSFLINRPKNILYQRIDMGVDQRIDSGMLEEVKRLIANGYEQRLRALGLEYRYFTEYLLDGPQTSERLKQKTRELKWTIHAFARRQLIWWRKRNKIIWLEGDNADEKILNYFR